MPLDDLPLNRPRGPFEEPPRLRSSDSRSRWLIVAAGIVVAGSVLALWWMSRARTPTVIPAPAAAADPTDSERRPSRQPLELPPLADSDSMLRQFVGELSRHPLLARFLASKGLVRTIAIAIVQIGDGKTPAVPLAVFRPSIRLETREATGAVDPANFDRWETAVRALQSVPTTDAAQLYVNVKPLLDEAYRELGYPEGDFDHAMAKAVRMLNGTPEVPADLVLFKREGYFEHESAALRSLPPVQKQLILSGPENRRRVLAWINQLAAALELKVKN